ncbi:tRNA-specific adenosine deaminase [compost metagenome]
MESNKHSQHMMLAKSVGEIYSKDRSTKVGAVIVGQDGEILSIGYNGFCRGFDDAKDANHERPLKYLLVAHAEANAIYNAARVGHKLKGSSIYVSSLPTCIECTKAIIQSGIDKVFVEAEALTGDRWKENWPLSQQMYKDCKVELFAIPNLDV